MQPRRITRALSPLQAGLLACLLLCFQAANALPPGDSRNATQDERQNVSAIPQSAGSATRANGSADRTNEATEFTEDATRAKPSEAEYWSNRVSQSLQEQGMLRERSSDKLYFELNRAFDRHAKALDKLLKGEASSEAASSSGGSPATRFKPYRAPETVDEFYQTLQVMHDQSLVLLEHLSPAIRKEELGTGVNGVKRARREIGFLRLTLIYRITKAPSVVENIIRDFGIAPLPTIGGGLRILLVCMIFYYWHRWAPSTLLRLRENLMAARPRSRRNLKLVKLIWYFDQVRSPIAWLVFVNVLFSFTRDPAIKFFIDVGEVAINWILLTWFAVLLVNALIARSSTSMRDAKAEITLQSLKLVGLWIIISGVNLDLITRYAGEGTVFAWTQLFNQTLLVLMILRLLVLWRPHIYEILEQETQQNFITEAVLRHHGGISSYIYTVFGAIYLLRLTISKRFYEWIADFSTGQQILDSILGIEMAKASLKQKGDEELTPITEDLEEKLLQRSENIIRQVGNATLKAILAGAEKETGGLLVLVSESGGGKSVILQRAAMETSIRSLLVTCPKEGFDALIKELARKLHIDSEEPKRRVVYEEIRQKEIKMLLIDDIHRVIKPYVGGQEAVDKIVEIYMQCPNLFLVVSLNNATWQFIQRARASKIFDQNVIFLQPWSSDQIGSLIKNSCEVAGIEPDFSKLYIPRQFDDNNFDNPKDRAFSGFIRILHGASGGNPRIALGLWTKSLYVNKRGKIIATLPQLPAVDELDSINLNVLLVLRIICQTEFVTKEDIINSLQITEAEVIGALRLCLFNNWIEQEDDYYQLNWYWRKVITRVLVRKNLMPRSF